ncbi:nitronate monooxygenase [Suttonella ornithocola]|uniref:nitronate monooxygenase n=1 Tax=Suttonella ornithocola TaxID=279832 RepID=UPI000934B5F2|nr:nitronate monooxygenase [Suttonella ornithocola]
MQRSQTAFKAGAQLAQLGTAFLATHESGISPIYKQALLHIGQTPTRLTCLFFGKWARGLENHFLTTYESHDNTFAPTSCFAWIRNICHYGQEKASEK